MRINQPSSIFRINLPPGQVLTVRIFPSIRHDHTLDSSPPLPLRNPPIRGSLVVTRQTTPWGCHLKIAPTKARFSWDQDKGGLYITPEANAIGETVCVDATIVIPADAVIDTLNIEMSDLTFSQEDEVHIRNIQVNVCNADSAGANIVGTASVAGMARVRVGNSYNARRRMGLGDGSIARSTNSIGTLSMTGNSELTVGDIFGGPDPDEL